MTLVAGFAVSNRLVLIGDLLGSARSEPARAKSISLPSVGDSRSILPLAAGYSLQLVQKIALVNSRLALACSGGWNAAANTVHDLRQLAAREPLSEGLLQSYFSGSCNQGVSGLAMYVTDDNHSVLFPFGPDVYLCESDAYGLCAFAGTGRLDLAESIALGHGELDGPPEFHVLTVAHNLFSRFLSHEINLRASDVALNPIERLYGAGYELVGMDENFTLWKWAESTLIYWEIRVCGDDIVVRAPTLFIRAQYHGTTLLLRWVRVDNWEAQTSVPWNRQHLEAIGPLETGVPQFRPTDPAMWPNFNNRYEGHFGLVTFDDGRREIFSWLWWPRPGSRLILFYEHIDGATTLVTMAPGAIERMRAKTVEGLRYRTQG